MPHMQIEKSIGFNPVRSMDGVSGGLLSAGNEDPNLPNPDMAVPERVMAILQGSFRRVVTANSKGYQAVPSDKLHMPIGNSGDSVDKEGIHEVGHMRQRFKFMARAERNKRISQGEVPDDEAEQEEPLVWPLSKASPEEYNSLQKTIEHDGLGAALEANMNDFLFWFTKPGIAELQVALPNDKTASGFESLGKELFHAALHTGILAASLDYLGITRPEELKNLLAQLVNEQQAGELSPNEGQFPAKLLNYLRENFSVFYRDSREFYGQIPEEDYGRSKDGTSSTKAQLKEHIMSLRRSISSFTGDPLSIDEEERLDGSSKDELLEIIDAEVAKMSALYSGGDVQDTVSMPDAKLKVLIDSALWEAATEGITIKKRDVWGLSRSLESVRNWGGGQKQKPADTQSQQKEQ